MPLLPSPLKTTLQRVAVMTAVLWVSRWAFFVYNYKHFARIDNIDIVKIFAYGLRFDVSTIIYLNFVYFGWYLFVFYNYNYKKAVQTIDKTVFVVINAFIVLVSLWDIAYFPILKRRTTFTDTSEILEHLHTATSLMSMYWYFFLLIPACIYSVVYIYNRTAATALAQQQNKVNWWIRVSFLGALAIFARGFGEWRITPQNLPEYIPSAGFALTLNTPAVLVYSAARPLTVLEDKHYTNLATAQTLFSIHQELRSKRPFSNKNVIVMLMESVSREYLYDEYAARPNTPFLDSLMAQSLVVPDAYANGQFSSAGFAAVVAGIPHLDTEHYQGSVYAANKLELITHILHKKGYTNNFYLAYDDYGFGLGRAAKQIYGFDNYIGRADFNDDTQYDGSFGIYDHAFFPFALRHITATPQPFFSVLFNVDTHFPFNAIPKYAKSYPTNGIDAGAAMTYYDGVLRTFFKDASKEAWFNNTVFVFVGDHYSRSEHLQNLTALRFFTVPIFFYTPDGSIAPERYNGVVQQTDLAISLLDYLGYNGAVTSFGKSIFDRKSKRYVFNYDVNHYLINDDNWFMMYDALRDTPTELYAYRTDCAMQQNLVHTQKAVTDTLVRALRARIQVYNYTLIHDKFVK